MVEHVFKKRLLVLRTHLLGKGFFKALAALNLAERYHDGVRKDGVTPEFDHQVSICLYLLTLPVLMDQEGVLICAILHDTMEDYPEVTPDVIVDAVFPLPEDHQHGIDCLRSLDLLNKYHRDGSVKNYERLYEEVANDPRASIVKAGDRFHNFKTMVGVFSFEKQRSYIEFAETYILPMMKSARRAFPRQTAAYENLKWMLNMQIELVRAIHEVADQ